MWAFRVSGAPPCLHGGLRLFSLPRNVLQIPGEPPGNKPPGIQGLLSCFWGSGRSSHGPPQQVQMKPCRSLCFGSEAELPQQTAPRTCRGIHFDIRYGPRFSSRCGSVNGSSSTNQEPGELLERHTGEPSGHQTGDRK
ncbi:hypothetical protein CgunFtcFv8_009959 [Champsocephalus gunnari]|uniref:Uncharacterized protein n=1 Tax=Champsocephalus gunnari TaxID=52237 RepID=A0AAN8H1Y2_CHAGU|nr:hypothetical protein CgunFtcFv8_009959 [Champsocephalus gunnari]